MTVLFHNIMTAPCTTLLATLPYFRRLALEMTRTDREPRRVGLPAARVPSCLAAGTLENVVVDGDLKRR